MSAILGMMLGLRSLVVGVEEDAETGGVRVYLDARYLSRYAVIDNPEAADEMRRQWRNGLQHLIIEKPPDEAITTDELRP